MIRKAEIPGCKGEENSKLKTLPIPIPQSPVPSPNNLTIHELTQLVGDEVTPRMVRHYHQLGLMPQPVRSPSNYRLYSEQDVQRLKRIVALKRQGFQLSHIHKLLEVEPESEKETLMTQLQQQYRTVMQQIAQLRQTATALEGLIGRDQDCEIVQSEALSQLKQLEVEAQVGLGGLELLWNNLDAEVHAHPEAFEESLQRLLPDLSDRSEIEIDLLSQLVLACGDVSLVPFVCLSKSPEQNAIAAARQALKSSCAIVADTTMVATSLDRTRLTHLGCRIETLIENPHIHNASEVEQEFWRNHPLQERVNQLPKDCIIVIGYAPSMLIAISEAVKKGTIQPSLIIGMPIGFSHAPAAKRQLMKSAIPYITIKGTIGGGLLAATTLNSLVASLLSKPDCHCYLKKGTGD
ncbi:precorrin-8X methylmutase [Floridanema aerugineum]|uniref:Precorrin-8X methylmutase n=1 Tax=Floridaenema aerugineum BLCC-F46 TaxID=3153654 RepID=A0ABV4WZE4_9CYAN